MTVGIVGANGQVGTELAFLFRAAGTEAVPVVRTPLAAATFDHYGFDYRIADVADDPSPPVGDLDAVVVAAFAPYISRAEYQASEARRDNRRIVEHVVGAAAADATVVYFSTVAAFGRAVGRSPLWWYVREKRRLERAFLRACGRRDVDGYALRLGHVLGVNQDVSDDLEDRLCDPPEVVVRADPSSPSNVVHTVTVRRAIRHCLDEPIDPGRYTLVNAPQWTWRDVVDYYAAPGTTVRYGDPRDGASGGSLSSRLVSRLVDAVPLTARELLTVTRFLPDGLARRAFWENKRRNRPSDVRAFKRRFDYHRREFDYDPVPGPFLPEFRVSGATIAEEEGPVPKVL